LQRRGAVKLLGKPLRLIADVLAADGTPRQLAFDVAFGLLLGLVPKGNLIAVALAVLLAAVRVNLAVAALTTFVVACLAPLSDPLTHRLGEWLLRLDALQEVWTWLYNQPLAPWTAFNNSVVLGSLATGLVLFYPAHRLSRTPIARGLPAVRRKLAAWRGREAAAS
jgi:uncharacterized protein (TIGR03546 family)